MLQHPENESGPAATEAAPRGSSEPPPVAGFMPSSLLEWEDRIAAVVILQGCNFRCPFCHSARFVRPGPPEREVRWDEVRGSLVRNAGWIDGVVVTGGEPTVHAGLGALVERMRGLDLPVKLDTNGSAPEALEDLAASGLVAHVAMDVKAPLEPAAYASAAGLSGPVRCGPDGRAGREGTLEKIRASLQFLREGGVSYELRTTVCPAFFDEHRLLALARELAWADRWYLQAFRPVGCLDPEMANLPPTDPDWLAEVASRCREIAPGCRVRGERTASFPDAPGA